MFEGYPRNRVFARDEAIISGLSLTANWSCGGVHRFHPAVDCEGGTQTYLISYQHTHVSSLAAARYVGT